MSILCAYFRFHRKGLLLFLLFSAIFLTVFSLYRLPLAPVLYTIFLFLFLVMILAVVDYIRFYRKHMILRTMLENVTVSIDDLPLSSNLLEEDYQRLLQTLYSNKTLLLSETHAKVGDMIDYYTLWVHQIKTPIAAMRLLLQSSGYAEARELNEELFKIEQYVEMVLHYLRLDAGSTDYVIREYDLDTIVRQAVRKYAPQFIRRKIRLEYDDLNTLVLTDEKWLLFIIEQLLSNALKYTARGSIRIILEEPKTLCISDTGIGIASEDLPRIFEKGFTGYNGRADKKSTGIGLYLCQRIVTRLGYNLSVSSQVGEGTLVRLNLESRKLEVE